MFRTSAQMREVRRGAVLVTLLIVAVLSCESLSGQTIRGRALDSGSGRPVASAQVSLIGPSAELVARAETDSLGWFVVRSPEEGTFFLRAERIGYHSVTDGVFELGDGGEMTVAFYIRSAPIELPPEDLEGRFIADASDLYRKVPGLAVPPGDVVAVN